MGIRRPHRSTFATVRCRQAVRASQHMVATRAAAGGLVYEAKSPNGLFLCPGLNSHIYCRTSGLVTRLHPAFITASDHACGSSHVFKQEEVATLERGGPAHLSELACRVVKAAGRSALHLASMSAAEFPDQKSMLARCGLLARLDECAFFNLQEVSFPRSQISS